MHGIWVSFPACSTTNSGTTNSVLAVTLHSLCPLFGTAQSSLFSEVEVISYVKERHTVSIEGRKKENTKKRKRKKKETRIIRI